MPSDQMRTFSDIHDHVVDELRKTRGDNAKQQELAEYYVQGLRTFEVDDPLTCLTNIGHALLDSEK